MEIFFLCRLVLSCLIVALTLRTVSVVSAIRPSFRSFEDYLQHLDKNLQTSIVRLGGADDQNGATAAPKVESVVEMDESYDAQSHNALANSIGSTVDHGEKNNVTCCILGEMAGDKGFHCFAEFYAARIQLRNMNRAHTKKLGFYGRDRLPHYGERLMKTFEQCVAGHGGNNGNNGGNAGHGQVFHRCCHLATLERREMDLRGGSVATGAGGKRKTGRDRKFSSEEENMSASVSGSSQESSSSSMEH